MQETQLYAVKTKFKLADTLTSTSEATDFIRAEICNNLLSVCKIDTGHKSKHPSSLSMANNFLLVLFCEVKSVYFQTVQQPGG